jgi:hypothetical protein
MCGHLTAYLKGLCSFNIYYQVDLIILVSEFGVVKVLDFHDYFSFFLPLLSGK